MKVLTIPGASFRRVAYAGNHGLVALMSLRGHQITRLWDIVGGRPARTILPPQSGFVRPLFIPGGERFLRVQGLWPDGADLPSVRSEEANEPHPLLEPNHWQPIAFGPDGTTAIYREQTFTRGGGSVRFHWRDAAGAFRSLFSVSGVSDASATISPDGKLAALTGGDRVVELIDLTTLRSKGQLEQSENVIAVAFTAGRRLAVTAGRTVRLWDVAQQRVVFESSGFRGRLRAQAVSPDGELLVVGGGGGVVCLWEARTGIERASHDWGVGEVADLAFAPDMSTAAVAGKTGIAIWDIE